MPTIRSVSLILYSDSGQTDRRIRQAVEAIESNHWQTQVLVVDRVSEAGPQEPITCQPTAERFQNLDEALKGAKHDAIAIVDRGIVIDANQFQIMASRIDRSPIQVAYTDAVIHRNQLTRLSSVLIWIYRRLVQFLLRSGKSEFERGLILFNATETESVLGQSRNCSQPEDPMAGDESFHANEAFGITQLLALAGLNRRPVSETKLGELELDVAPTTPDTKQILHSIRRALRFWWNRIMFPRQHHELPQKGLKKMEKGAAIAVLALIAVFVLFRCLSFPFFEPDEARNAQLAMNIASSGQWMSLSLAEDYYWDKPPMQLWAIAASYKLFGVSQLSTRLPIVVASLLTLLFTFFVGQKLVGFRSAWLGTLLLLLSTGFVCTGRYVTMDASLTAMVTAALLLGFLAIRGPFSKRHAVAAGVACGIGILVKGPLIGVLCLPPLLAINWISPTTFRWPSRWWLWFAVPAFLVPAPWFIATSIIHPEFVVYFFWKHHVVRFSDAFNHREPFWYYLVGIFVFMFPASYLIPSVTKFLTSRKPENRLLRTREHGFLFLSALWIIAFFSISESKLPTYIVPSFPAICLLMGVLLDRKIYSRQERSIAVAAQTSGSSNRTWLEKIGGRAPLELLFWFTVTSGGVLISSRREMISFSTIELVSAISVLASLTVVSIVYRKQQRIAWTCFAIMGLCMVSWTAHRLIPTLSKNRSIHLAASELHSTEEFQNAPYVFFGREDYGASLMLDAARITCFDETETQSMIEFLTKNPSSIIVSSEDPMEILRRDLPWSIELQEFEGARHLYVSRPNPAVIASGTETTLIR